MHCQTGWVISDYTNLSRYITPVQSKPDSHSVPSPARIQNTMMQDWRAQVGCVCMPTFLWHAANIGSHRNPANCSVGKEVVLTSCRNVTLLCSCGHDLTHTAEKYLTFTNESETSSLHECFQVVQLWLWLLSGLIGMHEWRVSHHMDQ